jgi:hypothetical protein
MAHILSLYVTSNALDFIDGFHVRVPLMKKIVEKKFTFYVC